MHQHISRYINSSKNNMDEAKPYLSHTQSVLLESIFHIILIIYLSVLLRPRSNPGYNGLLIGADMINEWRIFQPNNNAIEMVNI